MIPTIVVYNGSSNTQLVRLLDKGTPVKLHCVTKIQLRLDSGATVSSVRYPEAIGWKSKYKNIDLPDGVLILRLGGVEELTTRTYNSEVFVFDEYNEAGVFFGYLRIRAVEI